MELVADRRWHGKVYVVSPFHIGGTIDAFSVT